MKWLSFHLLRVAKMIKIQREEFNVGDEYQRLRKLSSDDASDNKQSNASSGAIVTFTGLVRDLEKDNRITALHLEHYPGMTEKSLEKIVEEAHSRWPLNAVTIIHRIGEIKVDEQIVFVGTASAHRDAAFASCNFLMDYLKTQAPFWKKAIMPSGEEWIDAKQSDSDAAKRW